MASKPKTKPTTSIGRSTADQIFVKEMNLVDDLMGKVTFTEMFLLELTGKLPPPAHTKMLDAVLVTLMEHGITPSAIATRLIYYSSPDSLQSAVAAGLLGVGSTFIGTMEGCAGFLGEMLEAPEGQEARAKAIVARHVEARKPIHGFGHPFHVPDDPRPARLFTIAREAGAEGRHIAALLALAKAVDAGYGRHLTINATGACAALLGEIGLSHKVMRGVAVGSRSAGLVGHIMEDIGNPSGKFIWNTVEEALEYQPK